MLHRASQVRRLPTLVPFRRREGARIEMAGRRIAAFRRTVWYTLVDAADDNAEVAISAGAIAAAIGVASRRGPASRSNVQRALRWLRGEGLIDIVDQASGLDNRTNTYRLRVPRHVPRVRRRRRA